MAATRTSPSGQSLDPGGWMGRKGPLCLGLGWTQPLPGSSGEESRADQDSGQGVGEFYWLAILSGSRQLPQSPQQS